MYYQKHNIVFPSVGPNCNLKKRFFFFKGGYAVRWYSNTSGGWTPGLEKWMRCRENLWEAKLRQVKAEHDRGWQNVFHRNRKWIVFKFLYIHTERERERGEIKYWYYNYYLVYYSNLESASKVFGVPFILLLKFITKSLTMLVEPSSASRSVLVRGGGTCTYFSHRIVFELKINLLKTIHYHWFI